MKHTPGPWEFDIFGAIRGGVLREFVNGSSQQQIAMACGIEEGIEVKQANTRLIAASPILLEALKKLVAEAKGFHGMADVQTHGVTNLAVLWQRINEAESAIAKAEG